MILLTLGTTEPFDRLVMAMDVIASQISDKVIAQVPGGAYTIKNMETIGFLSPTEYYKVFDQASLIISHAGMGTIISSLAKQKPIIVMPRRGFLNEANSDHQFATAEKLAGLNYVRVADNAEELLTLINKNVSFEDLSLPFVGPFASPQLINSLKDCINQTIK